ncbi:MAG: Wzz/FepE/Etk N-terminal domain-containing protein [Flavobacteriales bacterium]|nr:Wzz/FepE/Etk N-terminal domain-containing protein [Flavobacteriales bacterium]
MNDSQNIKRLLLPLLKGIPFLAILLVVALFAAYRYAKIMVPKYQSITKIKLDHTDHGISSSNLYKDFDVFAHVNKVKAEEELLTSNVLIKKAIQALGSNIKVFRIGEFRKSELYDESPIIIQFDTCPVNFYNKEIYVEILDEEYFSISELKAKNGQRCQFGEEIFLSGAKLRIVLNRDLIDGRADFHLQDLYSFKIQNEMSQVADIKSRLDVQAVDKDVAVLRLVYEDEVPTRAAEFVNTLAEAYIKDYVEHRTESASITVDFIDSQLDAVKSKLRKSESRIESYRLDKNIINTRQETETDLRKISQLKIQLANLEMNQAALDSLVFYIQSEQVDFLNKAPNFEAFNDLLSTELVKQIKAARAEKREVLLKYTPGSDEVQLVEQKIQDLVNYLKESINNTRKNIRIKRKQIDNAIIASEKVFEGLPTKEKEMMIMERDFQLNQKVYNFLTEKRTEAAIVANANMAFHRIIEKAEIPKESVTIKSTFLMVLSGFLALVFGIAIIYLKEYVKGTVNSRDQIEQGSTVPVAGIIKKNGSDQEGHFIDLASSLYLKKKVNDSLKIALTSSISGEGKSYVTAHLGKAFAKLGYRTLLIDFNSYSPSLHRKFEVQNTIDLRLINEESVDKNELITNISEHLDLITNQGGQNINGGILHHKRFASNFEVIVQDYDIVIIDTPASALSPDAMALMQKADLSLYLFKAGYTRKQYLLNPDLIAEEYGINNMMTLLNGAHKAMNFNGNYTGSSYSYKLKNENLKGRISRYIRSYIKA